MLLQLDEVDGAEKKRQLKSNGKRLDALPSNLVSSGALSSLQLQFVGLACQRHLTVMPTDPPTRAGFFLGDGAGVGKGRQLAAVLLDSLAPMSHSL